MDTPTEHIMAGQQAVVEHIHGIIDGRIGSKAGQKPLAEVRDELYTIVKRQCAALEVLVSDEDDILPKEAREIAELYFDVSAFVPHQEGTVTSLLIDKGTNGLHEVRYREKSLLSANLKGIILEITGRTPRMYDQRGLKFILTAPETPVVDFNRLWAPENVSHIVDLLVEWDLAGQPSTKEQFVRLMRRTWSWSSHGAGRVMQAMGNDSMDSLARTYWDMYRDNGFKALEKSQLGSLASTYQCALYLVKFKELFILSTMASGQQASLERLFLQTFPTANNRTEHRRNLNNILPDTNTPEIQRKITQFVNWQYRITPEVLRNRIQETFAGVGCLDTSVDIEQAYRALLSDAKFSRDYQRKEREHGLFLFDDVFVPVYRELFEQANTGASLSFIDTYISSVLDDRERELTEIGPRRLLYKGNLGGRFVQSSVLATTQDILFAEPGVSYTVVAQRWVNPLAVDVYHEARQRTLQKTPRLSLSVDRIPSPWTSRFRESGFAEQHMYREQDGSLHILLSGCLSSFQGESYALEYIFHDKERFDAPEQRTKALAQAHYYAQTVQANLAELAGERNSFGTAMNKSPSERGGVSIFDVVMRPDQKPAGAFMEQGRFPLELMASFGLSPVEHSWSHLFKDNISYPKTNGYQCGKMVVSTTGTPRHDIEFMVQTPLMDWHQRHGPSAHNASYKEGLVEKTLQDLETAYAQAFRGNEFRGRRQSVHRYLMMLQQVVAEVYVEQIVAYGQALTEEGADKPAILGTMMDMHARLMSEIPLSHALDGRFASEGIHTLRDVAAYVQSHLPQSLKTACS